jgi:glyoxylate utilization-related uncharacterized protein
MASEYRMAKKFALSGPLIKPLLVAIIVVGIIFLVVRNIDGFSPDVSNAIRMYDNSVTYSPGAVISFNGVLYEMVEGAGAPGYAPLRPGDKLWKALYDNNTTYQVGANVRYKGQSYTMVEGAGAPGYAPDRQGDKLWAKAYSDSVIYNVGDRVSFNGSVYKMVEGAGAAGYSPSRPGDRLWQKQ